MLNSNATNKRIQQVSKQELEGMGQFMKEKLANVLSLQEKHSNRQNESKIQL